MSSFESTHSPTFAAPSATAYGRHLRTLLRAVLDGFCSLLNDEEQRLLLTQEGVSEEGMDILSRLLQRVDPQASDDSFTSHDVPLLCFGGWTRELPDGFLRCTKRGRRMFRLALRLADQGRIQDMSLPVTCGLDGRHLANCPLGRTLNGVSGLAPQEKISLPWRDRPTLDEWIEALDERDRPVTESAWLRALSRVSRCEQATHLGSYHLHATYQWCKRLCAVTDALPYDPRRLIATLRALRPVVCAPSLARWQANRLERLLPINSYRRQLARSVAGWRIWSEGERQRWELRAKGERRAKAWPDVTSRKLAAWIDHDAQGGVVADGLRVEMCALRQLHQEGWQGIHAEGGFWLGLTMLMSAPLLLDDRADVWSGPWQTLPSDWARWGFIQRRKLHIDDLAQVIRRDALAHFEQCWETFSPLNMPGWASFPDPAVARLVCQHMDGLVLARMIRRIVTDPRAAAGLPDLLCWRGDELMLWEVKSPGDALSDRQRAWLTWFQQEGVDAGVLRVVAQVHRQTSILDQSEPIREPDQEAKPRTRRRSTFSQSRGRPRKRPDRFPVLELLDEAGKRWTTEAGALVPGSPHLRFAQHTDIHVALWSGVTGPGAVNGWQRPVDGLSFVPVIALRWAGVEGLAEQQWITVPRNWGLPILQHHEANPDGGLREVATILWRRGGWLVEAHTCASEPVVEPLQDLRQATSGSGYDWEPHPQRPPFRPLQEAEADGFGSELAQQLSLLNGVPYMLVPEQEGLAIAMPEGAGCLWIVDHPKLQRTVLPWQ